MKFCATCAVYYYCFVHRIFSAHIYQLCGYCNCSIALLSRHTEVDCWQKMDLFVQMLNFNTDGYWKWVINLDWPNVKLLCYMIILLNYIILLFQVIDLSEIPPEGALEWCLFLPHVTWRVLVAGGDGTVGWVLSAIDKLKLKVSLLY